MHVLSLIWQRRSLDPDICSRKILARSTHEILHPRRWSSPATLSNLWSTMECSASWVWTTLITLIFIFKWFTRKPCVNRTLRLLKIGCRKQTKLIRRVIQMTRYIKTASIWVQFTFMVFRTLVYIFVRCYIINTPGWWSTKGRMSLLDVYIYLTETRKLF